MIVEIIITLIIVLLASYILFCTVRKKLKGNDCCCTNCNKKYKCHGNKKKEG